MDQSAREFDQRWRLALGESPANDDAVSALRELLFKGLRRAVGGRTRVSESDIEDFTQLSVLRVMSRLESFKGLSRLSTWALAIAVHVAVTEMRSRRWGDRSLSGHRAQALTSWNEPESSSLCDNDCDDLKLIQLRKAIDSELTPHQRAAILAELAGMPTEVIAQQLGLTANALYKLHHDARCKLRVVLTRAVAVGSHTL